MKPCSFSKLEYFLKERKRQLSTYVKETREVAVDPLDEGVVGEVEEDLEIGQDQQLGHSEDEEVFSDNCEDDQDSD